MVEGGGMMTWHDAIGRSEVEAGRVRRARTCPGAERDFVRRREREVFRVSSARNFREGHIFIGRWR